jgi:hypothetical protein
MIGLRTKLLAGLAGLLGILIASIFVANSLLVRYSDSIQHLFHDDYDSAADCQAMKEALEGWSAGAGLATRRRPRPRGPFGRSEHRHLRAEAATANRDHRRPRRARRDGRAA